MDIRGKAAAVALSAGVLAGCGSMPEISSQSIDTNLDYCGEANPFYGAYDPTQPEAKKLGVLVSPDSDAPMPLLSASQTEALEEGLESIYGFDIIFPELGATEGIYTYERALTGSPEDIKIKSTLLQHAAGALSLYPTQMVQDSDPQRLVFTPNLTDIGLGKTTRVGGGYNVNSRTIYVNFGRGQEEYKNVQPRIFHETLHGIEVNVMCGAEDFQADTEFSNNTVYANYSGQQNEWNPAVFKVDSSRQFYNKHAGDNVMEDRVTTATSLFYGRGRVQPQDKDHGSEFDRKQAEYEDRLEAMSPGISQAIEDRTDFLRDEATNEVNTD